MQFPKPSDPAEVVGFCRSFVPFLQPKHLPKQTKNVAVTSTALLRVTALVMVSSHFTKRTDVRAAKPWLLVSQSPLVRCWKSRNGSIEFTRCKKSERMRNSSLIQAIAMGFASLLLCSRPVLVLSIKLKAVF